jgi:hypothetical protein
LNHLEPHKQPPHTPPALFPIPSTVSIPGTDHQSQLH